MSSTSGQKLSSNAPTVLELGQRRSLETARTLEASVRLALGTSPPGSNAPNESAHSGLDAHLIAIGTPPPGSQIGSASQNNSASPSGSASQAAPTDPKTVFLGQPAYVKPSRAARRATMPPRPRPAITLALLFGLLALVIAPLAPIAWMHAAEQLDLVARGARRDVGRRTLHAMQGIGIAMTMVAVAATAFGLTVMLVR
jgi:hypothetical protein